MLKELSKQVVSNMLLITSFIIAIILLVIILIVIIKMNPFRTVERKYWKKYLKKCVRREEWEEAAYVRDKLEKHQHQERIRLPFGYQLKHTTKLVDSYDSPLGFTFKSKKFIVKTTERKRKTSGKNSN